MSSHNSSSLDQLQSKLIKKSLNFPESSSSQPPPSLPKQADSPQDQPSSSHASDDFSPSHQETSPSTSQVSSSSSQHDSSAPSSDPESFPPPPTPPHSESPTSLSSNSPSSPVTSSKNTLLKTEDIDRLKELPRKRLLPLLIFLGVLIFVSLALFIVYQTNTRWSEFITVNFTPDQNTLYFASRSPTEEALYSGTLTITNNSPLATFHGAYRLQIASPLPSPSPTPSSPPEVEIDLVYFNIPPQSTLTFDIETQITNLTLAYPNINFPQEKNVEAVILQDNKEVVKSYAPLFFHVSDLSQDLNIDLSLLNPTTFDKNNPLEYSFQITNQLDIPVESVRYQLDLISSPEATISTASVISPTIINLDPRQTKILNEAYPYPSSLPLDENETPIHSGYLRLTVTPVMNGPALTATSEVFNF